MSDARYSLSSLRLNETGKFINGPFKALVFTLLSYDEKECQATVKFASYGKAFAVTTAQVAEWGYAPV